MANNNANNTSNAYMLKLTKGIAKGKGGAIVDVVHGGLKLFVRKPYGSQTTLTMREVDGRDRDGNPTKRKVVNVEGFYHTDETFVKAIQYFFGKDVSSETRGLTVRIALWDKAGERLMKFDPQEKDLYMFFIREAHLEEFQRRDNSVGYSLTATAFDFEPIRTQKRENAAPAQNVAPAQNAAPAQATAPAQSANVPAYDDYAAIDDSEDLPF